jgi:hypothetical protein
MRHAAATLALAVLVAAASACFDLEDQARVRAASEFGCPYEQIGISERSDLSDYTVDVSACGHYARYTCLPSRRPGARSCVREPLESPVPRTGAVVDASAE